MGFTLFTIVFLFIQLFYILMFTYFILIIFFEGIGLIYKYLLFYSLNSSSHELILFIGFDQIRYPRVFEVADYESEIIF